MTSIPKPGETRSVPESGLLSAYKGPDPPAAPTAEYVIKEFFSAAAMSFIDERDSTALILAKPGMDKFFVNVLGCNTDRRWLVMPKMFGSLVKVWKQLKIYNHVLPRLTRVRCVQELIFENGCSRCEDG